MKDKIKYFDDISESLLTNVKETVSSLEPDAEIYLFGSRARGDYQTDSDWDLLVLLPGDADYSREKKIIHALCDIEVAYRQIFNTIVHRRNIWNYDKIFRATPFHENVMKDRILI